ncbi:MAG: Methyltransferase, FkbM family [uncultured Frankineae bacterium]|uniref:Methyltransferase, FkbM family n=1 Tax=uncultured Frankineae bacterium TaxID=437475 RepID=A0A6J4MJ27_9ACTN|nr:MAG: Methyltransferase, FkbM family [uncultured Frankineae bacterium]
MTPKGITPRRVVNHARWRAMQLRKAALNAYYRRAGLELSARGLRACGVSTSDKHVFGEIFGDEDAYRLDVVVPLMRGGTVVEVGAHKGYFTVLAGSAADRVVVFEPTERNYEYVLRNVALNGLTNVTAVQAAVSDTAGVKPFTLSAVNDARHTFFSTRYSGSGTTVEVRCVTLPEALEEHGVEHVDLLKLDCEGSEYDALLSCDAPVLARIDHIVAELHESRTIPHTRSDLISHLARHGFTAELYDEHVRGDLRTCMAFFSAQRDRGSGTPRER